MLVCGLWAKKGRQIEGGQINACKRVKAVWMVCEW